MKYNKNGEELPDPTPVEVPLRFRRTAQDELHDQIRAFMRSEAFAARMAANEVETEQEADDFDVDGEEDLDLPLAPAERAYLMAEELRAAQGDLLELEGSLRSGPAQPVKEGAEGGSTPLPGGPGAEAGKEVKAE